jgi:hypothetical protein
MGSDRTVEAVLFILVLLTIVFTLTSCGASMSMHVAETDDGLTFTASYREWLESERLEENDSN